MSQNLTIYTGEPGYKLFLKGMPFVATENKTTGDYKVITPLANLVKLPSVGKQISYDVVNLNGVIVEKD